MAMITVDGNGERLVGYSVSENATPLDPNDSSSGFGQLTYSTRDSKHIGGGTTLVDPLYGEFSGTISRITKADRSLFSVTADDVFSSLDKWVTMRPYAGSLSGYLSLIRTTTGADPVISTSLSKTVIAPGYRGNAWTEFKKFLAAHELEASNVQGQIVVTNPRTTTIPRAEHVSHGWSGGTQNAVHTIRVPYKEMAYSTVVDNAPVFPDRSRVEDVEFSPISVEPGETIRQQITLTASLESVNQPVAQDYVSASESGSGTAGMYCVVDQSGKPIPASSWVKGGGRVQVKLTPDPSVVDVIVTASRISQFGTYRIAAGVGNTSDSFYNSLRITGRGIRWVEGEITLATGAPPNADGENSVQDVDNRFIVSRGMAYDAGVRCGAVLSGPDIKTSGQFRPSSAFRFGELTGSRIKEEENLFRIESATFNPGNTSYNARRDTLISDYLDHYGTITIAQFNALFPGAEIQHFMERSLI